MRQQIGFLPALALVVSFPGVAPAQGQKLFGYAGVSNQDFAQMEEAGILTNTGTLELSDTARVPDWNGQQLKKRPILLVDFLFFRFDANLDTPCRPYSLRLRRDWRQRADRWFAANQQYLTSDQVAGIVPASEANNGCLDPDDLQLVAQYIVGRVPSDVLIGMGEGSSEGAKPLLPWIPWEIDFVALFDYVALDPEDPGLQTSLDELNSQLQAHQSYFLVPKAFLFFWEMAGYPRWKLGNTVVAYARYCAAEPRCLGVLPFLYDTAEYSAVDGTGLLGTDQMPQIWPRHAEASRILLGPGQ
jgi:hypothetical protein